MKFIKQENWKDTLDNLKNIYSNAQLSVVLGLSHSAVSERLNKFSYTSYENKIFDIHNKLNNTSPQIIFFIEWCNRLFKNEYILTYRAIRHYLKLSNKHLNFLNNKSNLSNYENNTNIMSKKNFTKFLNYLNNKNIKYNKREIIKYKNFIKNQIKDFINNKFYLKCPSIINILPHINTVKGIKKEYELYNKLKKLYPNIFLGCTLSKNLKRKDNIDILAFDNKDVIVFEIKDFRKYNQNLRGKLKDLNYHLKRLKRDYKEITKTIAILPSLNISKEIKDQFLRNNNILLDQHNFNSFLNKKLIKKEIYGKNEIANLKRWLNKFNISSYMLQGLFKMNNINIDVGNAMRKRYNFNKISNKLKPIETILNKKDKRKIYFLVNEYFYFRDNQIVFWRNLRRLYGISLGEICLKLFGSRNKNKNMISRIETGKHIRKKLKEQYKTYLNNKIKNRDISNKVKKLIIEEKKRWETAKKFPMVVGLVSHKHNQFENQIAMIMKNKGYEIITNALINDKNLTKMTLNFHHPESDIIAKKNNSYTLISCKETSKKPNNNQFYIQLKHEIDKLYEYNYGIEFSKIILAVKANLSNKTWETLKNYAQDNNIKIWKIKNG